MEVFVYAFDNNDHWYCTSYLGNIYLFDIMKPRYAL